METLLQTHTIVSSITASLTRQDLVSLSLVSRSVYTVLTASPETWSALYYGFAEARCFFGGGSGGGRECSGVKGEIRGCVKCHRDVCKTCSSLTTPNLFLRNHYAKHRSQTDDWFRYIRSFCTFCAPLRRFQKLKSKRRRCLCPSESFLYMCPPCATKTHRLTEEYAVTFAVFVRDAEIGLEEEEEEGGLGLCYACNELVGLEEGVTLFECGWCEGEIIREKVKVEVEEEGQRLGCIMEGVTLS